MMKEDFNDLDPIQEDESESTVEGKSVFRTKRFIISVILGIVLIASGVLAWFYLFSDDEMNPEMSPVVQRALESPVTSPEPETEDYFEDIMSLNPFERIPLKDNANMSLITLKISLELADPGKDRQQVASLEPAFRKMIEEQTAQYTWLELRSPEGKIKFKYELLRKMNSQSDRVLIRNIFFTYFLMQ